MKQYVVDAFTESVFTGNPAAVCVLERWLPDGVMQKIAAENCLSETAFAVKTGDRYHLRWFTPGCEVGLCGHATLATAYVLTRFYEPEAQNLTFDSRSGVLTVEKQGDRFCLDFPAARLEAQELTPAMTDMLGAVPAETFIASSLMFVLDSEEQVREFKPDFAKMLALPEGTGVLITAPAHEGADYDFVSRCFFPKQAINEDPVCGSAHCRFVPYWAKRLGKSTLTGRQLSARGGYLYCEDRGDRVRISGPAALFSQAIIHVPVEE
ncbi:MAG: PhzF family phenazine biosynthesis protein [Clostridia bacterium]|nr:PhzF family phenazine biosynthesis protein [Clostridia bacterium]